MKRNKMIKYINSILVICIYLSINGCTDVEYFGPNVSKCLTTKSMRGCLSPYGKAPYYSYWEKDNVTNLEIQKAMLECGLYYPFDDSQDINSDALGELCMIKSGFSAVIDDYTNLVCKYKPNTTACSLPWDKIPNRSIKRRLESNPCKHKIYKTYPVCQP